jgi:glycine cleavage system H protein
MTLSEILEWTGVIVVGAAVRLLLMAAIVAAVVLPILAVLDAWQRLRRLRSRLSTAAVSGLPWRKGLAYGPAHTWLRRGWGRRATVGVDALVPRLLGEVQRLSLPRVGARLAAGDVAAVAACSTGEAAIRTPVAGRVTRVNASLEQDPQLVMRDPYDAGWLYRLEPTNGTPLVLRRGEAARAWFGAEAARLARCLEGHLGTATADGGELVQHPTSLIEAERWKALTHSFLDAA